MLCFWPPAAALSDAAIPSAATGNAPTARSSKRSAISWISTHPPPLHVAAPEVSAEDALHGRVRVLGRLEGEHEPKQAEGGVGRSGQQVAQRGGLDRGEAAQVVAHLGQLDPAEAARGRADDLVRVLGLGLGLPSP